MHGGFAKGPRTKTSKWKAFALDPELLLCMAWSRQRREGPAEMTLILDGIW